MGIIIYLIVVGGIIFFLRQIIADTKEALSWYKNNK